MGCSLSLAPYTEANAYQESEEPASLPLLDRFDRRALLWLLSKKYVPASLLLV